MVACPQCQAHLRVPAAAPPVGSPGAPATPLPSGAPAREPPPSGPAGTEGGPEWRPNLDERDQPSERLLRELPSKLTPELAVLGAPLAVFRPSTVPRVLCFAFGGMMTLVALLMSALVLALLIVGMNRRGGRLDVAPQSIACGLISLLAGPSLLAAGFFLFRRRILVCQEGVAQVHNGGGVETFRWDQVHSTYESVTRVRLYNRYGMYVGFRIDRVYTVVRDDDFRLVFTNGSCQGVERFWQIVQRETARRLTPAAFDAVVRDRRVLRFGDVGVGLDGLHVGPDVLPWDQVGGLSLADGRAAFRFIGGGDFTSIARNQIPNVHVFLNLVENLSGKRWR